MKKYKIMVFKVQGFLVPAVGKLVAPLGHWDALAVVARELVLSVN